MKEFKIVIEQHSDGYIAYLIGVVGAVVGQGETYYDRIGNILYIDKCPAYVEQESEEIGDEVIARLNPVSGKVENLEILFFSKRLNSTTLLELPIAADLKLL